jgi:hypothetical protein
VASNSGQRRKVMIIVPRFEAEDTMQEPYLVMGLRMRTTSPDNSRKFERILRRLEQLLAGKPLTQLKSQSVFVVEVSKRADARLTWTRVSDLLTSVDKDLNDDLEWFVTLCDRNGCELAYN